MGAPFQYNLERRPLFKQQLRIVFLQRGLHYRPLLFIKYEEKKMSEKKFKQVCKCENCGNEAEMMITCTLEEHMEKHVEEHVEPSTAPAEKSKIKGQAVCSHCGNEADMWIDL
jgi:ribosomal protein S14